MQLGEALRKYYQEELTTANQHRNNTIKNIKAIFKVWVFRNTYDKNILIGQDWDLCIKLAQITDICTIGHFSVKWRRYEGSVTGKTDNFLQSRFDKLKNLKNGEKCIKSVFSYFKNRNRQGVENLAISLIYIKKKMYSKFLIFFVKSILKSPFAIIINNNF